MLFFFFFFQAEDGIRDRSPSRGLGDVYKRQPPGRGDAMDAREPGDPRPADRLLRGLHRRRRRAVGGRGQGRRRRGGLARRAAGPGRRPAGRGARADAPDRGLARRGRAGAQSAGRPHAGRPAARGGGPRRHPPLRGARDPGGGRRAGDGMVPRAPRRGRPAAGGRDGDLSVATPLRTLPAGFEAVSAVRGDARPLSGGAGDYDALLDLVGDARVVLLGEASHGTHEFYRERARITKRLIRERGFTAVAVEGDWPDAYRVNRFVQGMGDDAGAEEALRGFRRFPTWMWRNADVLDFVGWLRAHNDGLSGDGAAAGFYGLDLYSLHASMEAVVTYLEAQDPAAAERARRRYECLQPFAGESSEYGRAVLLGASESCRRHVLRELVELRRRAADFLRSDGTPAEDEYFFAEQNAALVADAEEYY